MKHLALFLAVLLVASVAVAQDADKKTAVTVLALKVGRKNPADKDGKLSFYQEGVSLTLAVYRPDRFLIGVDEKKTTLALFTDDRKTDLLKKTGGWGGMSGISSFPKFSKDGHLCVFDINATRPPAKGARTLRVKAIVVLKYGEGEKTAVQKNLKLKKGSVLTVGPVPWTIKKVGKPEWGSADAKLAVSVEGSVNHDAIKKLVFLDSDGKEVEHRIGSTSSSGFGGRMTYGVEYHLSRKVDTVTVKVISFKKSGSIRVPVDLEVGVGL